MSMEITLYDSRITILDDEDYNKLKDYKYYANNKGYAYRNGRINKKNTVVYMHREIIGAKKGEYVDHINGNTLDNRKTNLRIVTSLQNQHNLRKSQKRKYTSKYKGVSWNEQRKGWLATIKVNYKQLKLGIYKTEQAAAIAYNETAKKHYGEYVNFNDVEYDENWKTKEIKNRREGSGKSKYIGVSYRPKYDDWQCHIMVNYKSIFLGTYKNEIDAAKAYNEAALKYRSEKAKLNIFD